MRDIIVKSKNTKNNTMNKKIFHKNSPVQGIKKKHDNRLIIVEKIHFFNYFAIKKGLCPACCILIVMLLQ